MQGIITCLNHESGYLNYHVIYSNFVDLTFPFVAIDCDFLMLIHEDSPMLVDNIQKIDKCFQLTAIVDTNPLIYQENSNLGLMCYFIYTYLIHFVILNWNYQRKQLYCNRARHGDGNVERNYDFYKFEVIYKKICQILVLFTLVFLCIFA